jgi:hypothetical protein
MMRVGSEAFKMAMQGVHQCRLLESLVVVIGGVASQNGHQTHAEGLGWTIFLLFAGHASLWLPAFVLVN